MSTKHLTVSSLFLILTIASLVYLLYSTTTAQAKIDDNSVVPVSSIRPDGDVNKDGREDVFDLLEIFKVLGRSVAVSEATDVKSSFFPLYRNVHPKG